jgi:hypothetical protein
MPHPDRFTPGNDPVPIVQEAGWAPGPVWTGTENLTPTGIRSPDHPARSELLYRLRYPSPLLNMFLLVKVLYHRNNAELLTDYLFKYFCEWHIGKYVVMTCFKVMEWMTKENHEKIIQDRWSADWLSEPRRIESTSYNHLTTFD